MDEKKPRKPQQKIVVGETYGEIIVISKISGRPPHYNCRCEICGRNFVATGQQILRNAVAGCPSCRKSEKDKQQEAEYKKHIGETYGALTVIEYVGKRCYGIKKGKEFFSPVMLCRCEKCGEETEIFLSRLKRGGAKQCAKCSQKNLDDGRDYAKKMLYVGGTSIHAIDGRRKQNKNSTNGHNGVSRTVSGMYRAYIYFKRKQYHLGSFSNIDEAIEARKRAEKEIYGDFLKWYAEEYPEKWEQIKKKEPGD